MGIISNISWFLRRRRMLKAFENGDIETIAKMGPPVSSPKVAEIGFHKARAASKSVSKARRLESLYWLYARGMGPITRRERTKTPPAETDGARTERKGWCVAVSCVERQLTGFGVATARHNE